MNGILKRLLRERGLTDGFLHPKYEDLADSMVLPDMKEAVERIKQAGVRGETVVIYGDYDVDGVCASVIMRQALVWAGIEKIEVLLPDRFKDGYGMNMGAMEKIEEIGAELVVTVDCGSGSREVVEALKAKGIDVIVTDHHECPGELPECPVVNPKRWGREEAEKKGVAALMDLSGTGVAFMVAKAMRSDGQEKWLLDLVAIGTLCDSMEMTRENRILTYWGMKVLKKTPRVGLKELMRVAGVKDVSLHVVGFQIGPRLNAGGRMKSAYKALDLLLVEKKMEAVGLAEELDRLNKERRRAQEEAVAEVEKAGNEDAVVVVRGEWHEGVIGIIAGKLTEKWQRPCFVFTDVGGELKGSGRSFGEFRLAQALVECQDCLLKGGGHDYACGCTIANEKFEELRERLNKYYISLELENQERFIGVREDIVVEDLGDLSLGMMEELVQLEPYGEGNKEPVFLLKNMIVLDSAKMGKKSEHLRLGVRDSGGRRMKCVGFWAKEEWRIEEGARVDLWVNLSVNEWRGEKTVEGMILGVERVEEI